MPVVLLCSANQTQDQLSYPEKEVAEISRILRPLKKKGIIDIEQAYGASLESLSDIFLSYEDGISIYHYAGHADADSIFLQDRPAQARGLARILGEQKKLQLVFLNGCSTMGQVKTLFGAGVKAVIGTSVPVGDERAMKFSKAFYDALASGRSIERAFNFAKGFIEADDSFAGTSAIEIVKNRGLSLRSNGEMPWNLFVAEEEQSVLDWKLYQKYSWSTWMKILAVALGSALLLGLAFRTFQPEPSPPSEPGIEIRNSRHKLGEVSQGIIVLDSIQVNNTGTQPLILKVGSPENWIEPLTLEDTINVKDSAIILIKIFTQDLSGRHKGTVNIESNAAKGIISVEYIVEVIKLPTPLSPPLMVLDPLFYDFGTIYEQTRKQTAIKVENGGGQNLRLYSVAPEENWLKVISYDRSIPAGGAGQIIIEARAVLPEGAKIGVVNVKSNAADLTLRFSQVVSSRFYTLHCPLKYDSVVVSYQFENETHRYTSKNGGSIELKIPRIWIDKRTDVWLTFRKGNKRDRAKYTMDGECINLPYYFRKSLETPPNYE